MTWFSEKMLISNRCICGFMPNLHKKSWMVSNAYVGQCQANLGLYRKKFNCVYYRVSVQGVKSLGGNLHVHAGGLNFMK